MTTPYTPGPWKTEHRKGADAMYRTEIFSEQHGGIATCEWTPKHCGNGVIETYREANARLIAAAPELLEAAKLVLEWYEAEDNHSGTDFYQRMQMCRDSEDAVRAAIAKATGEPA